MIINTRLGNAEIEGDLIPGTPMVIVTKGIVIPHRKKPLVIPDGGILIPRRYGSGKRQTVMMVYCDIFAALRSRRGTSAYYGRNGRGELYRIQRLTRSLSQQIAGTEDGREREGLIRLRDRFLGDLYDRSRLVSRLDIWATALFLELEEEKATLEGMFTCLEDSLADKLVPTSKVFASSQKLHLAPSVELRAEICKVIRSEFDGGVLYFKFNEFIEQTKRCLARIESEEIHFELKELERALSDDIRRDPKEGLSLARYYAATRAIVGMVERYLSVEDPSKLASRGDRELAAVLSALPFLIWACKHLSDGGGPEAALQLIKSARARMKEEIELS